MKNTHDLICAISKKSNAETLDVITSLYYALKERQWGTNNKICPECGNPNPRYNSDYVGHTENCSVGKALAMAEEILE